MMLFAFFSTNGHHDGAPQELPRQCPRCRVRLSGVLAGWHSDELLKGYDSSQICLACLAQLREQYAQQQQQDGHETR